MWFVVTKYLTLIFTGNTWITLIEIKHVTTDTDISSGLGYINTVRQCQHEYHHFKNRKINNRERKSSRLSFDFGYSFWCKTGISNSMKRQLLLLIFDHSNISSIGEIYHQDNGMYSFAIKFIGKLYVIIWATSTPL